MGRRESPLDPNAGPVQRFAYELRKLRSEAGAPTYRAMAQRVPYSLTTLSRAAAGEQLPSLPVTLAYVEACGGERAHWEERWREAEAEATGLPPEDDDATPPYRGLARFEPGDHERFFGRERLVSDLLELVRESRFAAVFGPSGSGKSSLLRAGLIPALRDGTAAPLPRPSVIRVLTPGDRPLRTHADALGPKLGPKGDHGDTWIVVDQFEEVFTLCQDPAERAEFIERLLSAQDEDSRLRVVIGVRADFFGRCAEHRELTAALRGATLLVGTMGRAELREAIVKPAAAEGLIVERALTARIVEEVVDEPGGLPLMSHALLETWRRRRSRALTVEAYEAAGGVHGAIALTAERVYEELSERQAEAARRIMLRLITPGEGAQDTRRPVDREELGLDSGSGSDSGMGDAADAADAALVLERLVRARLVTLDEGTVDLAHEALITAWPRLRGWIDEDRQRLRTHRKLTEAARTWEELGRDPGALYRGARLVEAREAFDEPDASAELTAVERDFLAASRTAGTRERRRVRTFVGSVAVLVALALVAGVVAWQQNRAGEQRRAEATSRRIASVAQNMRYADPVTAMRLSVAAWNVSHTVEARSALLGAMAQRPQDTFTASGGSADDNALLSADGRALVTSGMNSGVVGWDLATHRRISSVKLSDETETATAVSPDGRQVVTFGEAGLRLRDRASGRLIGPLIEMDEGDGDAYFGASGRTLVVQDGHWLRLWDIRHRRLLFRRPSETVQEPALSADDGRIALCSDQDELEVWDVRAHRRIRTLPVAILRLVCDPDADVDMEVALTPDGRRLLITTAKGVRGWELASGKELPSITHAGLWDLTLSRDGRMLAAADDQEILVWRLDSPGEPVYRHPLAGRRISGLRLDADHGIIRYQEGDGMASDAVRTLYLGSATTSKWGPKQDGEALFSPDASLIAEMRTSGERARIELRRTGGGASAAAALPSADCRTTGQPGHKGQYCLPLMAFSADGQTFAYGFGERNAANGRPRAERVAVWDVRKRRKTADLVLTPKGEDGSGVDSIALTPDGKTVLAYRHSSETLELWGIRSRTKVTRRPNGMADVVTGGTGDFWLSFPDSSALAVRPDGRMVTTASGERFTLPSGRPERPTRSQEPVYALAYRPDDEQLARGTDSGQVTLWDGSAERRLGVVAGTLTGEGRESAEPVQALAYSPDGKILAVAGQTGTLRLWDTASGLPLGSALLTAGDAVRAVSFTEDGRTLLVAGEHVPLQKFAIDPERVTTAVCERAGGGLHRADWKTYIPEVPYRKVC
ncbi:nSTAND1 domain-containing NTPase [Streptomyces sp. LZ34]